MTSRDFCYWLQGYVEINNADLGASKSLTASQVECMQKHLSLVFKHEIDPSYGNKQHQDKLNDVHQDAKVNQFPNIDPLIRC